MFLYAVRKASTVETNNVRNFIFTAQVGTNGAFVVLGVRINPDIRDTTGYNRFSAPARYANEIAENFFAAACRAVSGTHSMIVDPSPYTNGCGATAAESEEGSGFSPAAAH